MFVGAVGTLPIIGRLWSTHLQHALKAGISKQVTPHTMRHLFATDLLSNGADLRSVQTLLGHSSIITTQIYTHVTDKHLREIHKKYHNRQ